MKYSVTAQSNDATFIIEAGSMKEAYDLAEAKVGELDGNVSDEAYSVAEGTTDYYTIARAEED